jgi:hypothetical protein
MLLNVQVKVTEEGKKGLGKYKEGKRRKVD